MSRRGRAVAFVLAAACAAAAAAAIADGYGASVARGYGALRSVVVASSPLQAGQPIGPAEASSGLELRRVPARFVPPGALTSAAAAIGLAPVARVPAGAYLLATQLRAPRPEAGDALGLSQGRHPVEISVSGAAALLLEGDRPSGERVDVVVTTEPSGSGQGKTYVAAAAVPLLALGPGPGGIEAEGVAAATLGLSRRQALRLIAAESFARQITLLPRG
ncbi:MAG TPA: SAF domain-containing protein [Solirubrobacterales bacterium]|jgi:Flp pilus assembly protein CpaB|nr:SAF domain-containing protein [Solirubrobacterales bacterium]